jgi:O-antigen/teichoic acid export membrane protein
LAAVALSGSRFALSAIVARHASASEFGAFVYAQWLIDISFLVVSCGVTGVASRYVAQYRGDAVRLSEFLRKWPLWSSILPAVAGAGVLLGALLSGLSLTWSIAFPLVIWAVSSAGWLLQTAALTGLQRFDYILASNLVAGGVMVLGAWWVSDQVAALSMLYWVMAVASASAALIGAVRVGRERGPVMRARAADDTIDWRSVRTYAINMWFISLLWSLVWSRGELPVVKYYMGASGVAQYSAVQTLFGGAMQGVMLGLSAAAPQLTQLWGNDGKAEALRLARKLMNIQLVICAGVALILIFFGLELLRGVFGGGYDGQAPSLAILSAGLISMVVANQNHILQIETNGSYTRNSALLGVVLLFGASVVAINYFGVLGAAAARASVMLVLGMVTLALFSARWGAGSVSVVNCMMVGVVVAVAVAFVVTNAGASLPVRGGLFCLALIVLAISMRGAQGGNLIASLVRRSS